MQAKAAPAGNSLRLLLLLLLLQLVTTAAAADAAVNESEEAVEEIRGGGGGGGGGGSPVDWLLNRMRLRQRRRFCWKHSLTHLSRQQLNSCLSRFIRYANQQTRRLHRRSSLASFNYATNITESNSRRLVRTSVRVSKQTQKLTLYSLKFKRLRARLRMSRRTQRMLNALASKLIYPSSRMLRLSNSLKSRMTNTYSLARGCLSPGNCLPTGEDSVKKFFANSRNYSQLKYLWQSWRNATGRRLKRPFLKRARLLNLAAASVGFRSFADYEILPDFEDRNFASTVEGLYQQIKPFYTQLHAYLRYRLREEFPGKFGASDLLPGHLCNDPWTSMCQKWSTKFAPKPHAGTVDFDAILQRRQRLGLLKVSQLPRVSESFYKSLGLPPMTKKFWLYSQFKKPKKRKFVCHGTAYDMMSEPPADFRIKMCTTMDASSFSTVHHEMGHIMYFMLYSKQPPLLRDGANSGFHEAVGDTIILSVKTAKHFNAIKFAKNATQTPDSLLNVLLEEALENVMFIPYALVVDLWRWGVFNGSIPRSRLNSEWWRLRTAYQGVAPPVDRTEEDADPLAKYHTAKNIPYIRYFISFILKFQFYQSMCKAAGHTGELAECDFYKSKEAGRRLGRMLSLGKSVPWPEALSALTGSRSVSAQALLTYFAPLHRWLIRFNAEHKVPVGWKVPENPMRGVGE